VEANLRLRLLTALVGIPLVVLLVSWGTPVIFGSIIFVVTLLALHEYFTIIFPSSLRDRIIGIGFGLLISLLSLMASAAQTNLGISLLLILCFSVYLVAADGLEENLLGLAWTVLGGFYLGFLVPHWVFLFRLPNGRLWVLFVLTVIMVGDSVAYFIGRAFGKNKLAPRISPGKTMEGAWGYMLGSALAGLVAGKLLFESSNSVELVGLALMLGVLGQLGDLFESWIKRVFAVKDSGQLLPGHGGLLDRLDSLVFPAVFTTAYLKVFHS
jgi:phosphatidate cytidylyltransferase